MGPAGETVLEIEKQRWVLTCDRRLVPPGRGQRRRELRLFLDQLAGAVEGAAWLDQDQAGAFGHRVDHRHRLGEPGKPGLDSGEELSLNNPVPSGGAP